MSSSILLTVLGQAYFLGPLSIAPPVTLNTTCPTAPDTIIYQEPQLKPVTGIRREGYTYTPGIGAHKVHTQAAKWNDARKTCIAEGGHLAIINSPAESELITELFQKSHPHAGSVDENYVHIGFHDLYQENEFVTVLDEALPAAGFNEWAHGGANNFEKDENCGSMFKDGKLNDINCKKSIGFVCELPYVEENSITLQ